MKWPQYPVLHFWNLYFKRAECTSKAAPATTKVWFWRQISNIRECSEVLLQYREQPVPQSNLHTSTFLIPHFQRKWQTHCSLSWGFRHSYVCNLQCFMSTLLLVVSWSSSKWETWSHWCFQLPQSLGTDGSSTRRHRMQQMQQMQQDAADAALCSDVFIMVRTIAPGIGLNDEVWASDRSPFCHQCKWWDLIL